MASNPPPPRVPDLTATGWAVTSQTPTVELGPNGKAEQGYRVYFTTGKGATGSVFISQSAYHPDNVRAAIAAHAAQLDAVQQLTG